MTTSGKATAQQNNSTPNQILRQARLDHNKTLPDMGQLLGVKFQRVHQWEQRGDPIGLDHIARWASDETLPDWMREAAVQMWAASLQAALRQTNAQLGAQLDKLQAIIPHVYPQLRLELEG